MPSKKKRSKVKNKSEEPRATVRERIADVLELPREIVLDLPKLTMVGRGNMIIENYKGIVEYDSSRIRINTGIGVIKISGSGMLIKEITSEDIMVGGIINSVEILG
jgi:sporulation protein YqfC